MDRHRGLETRSQVREIYKLDDIAYFGKFSKQVSCKKKKILVWALATPVFFVFFSIRVFLFRDTENLDSRGREGTFICNLACEMTIIFLIASIVFTRLLLNEIYHFIELPFWLIDDVTLSVCLFMWWFYSSFFVIAIWAGKPVDSNSHRLLPLYYKWND